MLAIDKDCIVLLHLTNNISDSSMHPESVTIRESWLVPIP